MPTFASGSEISLTNCLPRTIIPRVVIVVCGPDTGRPRSFAFLRLRLPSLSFSHLFFLPLAHLSAALRPYKPLSPTMHPTLLLPILVSLASISRAVPMGFRASANDALLARGSAINLPGELEQVDEDDVARTWGDLLAGGVPLIFRGRTNATQAALARRSVSVISNPKVSFPLPYKFPWLARLTRLLLQVILNPKFAGKTSASASSSSTPTSSRASSTTSAPAATPTVGYTSSGLDLDGTHSGDATCKSPPSPQNQPSTGSDQNSLSFADFAPGLGACGTTASDTDYIGSSLHDPKITSNE